MAEEFVYENLLDRLYEKLPKKKAGGERFEMPIVDSFVAGPKTIVRNFDAICARIRRTAEDLAKYFSKELAVPAGFDGPRLALSGKFSQRALQERLNSYVRERVLCKECGKPDTGLVQIDRNVWALKCEACGAKSTVRA